MRQWFYSSGGQQSGPVTSDELKRLASAGQLSPEDLVWSDGMPEWVAAKTLITLWSKSAGQAAAAKSYAAPAPAPAPAYDAPVAAYAQPADQAAAYEQAAYQPQNYGQPGTAGALQYEAPAQAMLYVSPQAIESLRQTKPWVRLFSILLFIAVGVIGLAALIQFISALGMASSRSRVGGGFAAIGVLIAVVTLAIGALYFFPAMFLGRYASKINAVVSFRRQSDFEAALEAQKAYWKFLGILTLVVFCLYVLVFLVAIVGTGMMASRM